MSYELSNGKVRVTPARPSDHANHADGANAVDRLRNHVPDAARRPGQPGRSFAAKNTAAKGTGARRTIRNLVPARGRRVFDDLCLQIGVTGGTLGFLHAADAVVHQLDALELSELARAAGLGTAEGKELHARAQRSSELAIRSATAALDAARLFARPGAAKRTARKTPVGFAEGEIA